jgi:hypothetical protein
MLSASIRVPREFRKKSGAAGSASTMQRALSAGNLTVGGELSLSQGGTAVSNGVPGQRQKRRAWREAIQPDPSLVVSIPERLALRGC